MIQRIQSLLFLFASLCNLGTLFFPFWQFQNTEKIELVSGIQLETTSTQSSAIVASTINFLEQPLHTGIFGLTVLCSLIILVIIFLYQNRKRQMNLGYVSIVLLLIQIGLMAYFTYKGPYSISSEDQGMVQLGFAFPVVALVLTWIGIRSVKKDEDLIRSVDRIR